jgi:hypothetical protein
MPGFQDIPGIQIDDPRFDISTTQIAANVQIHLGTPFSIPIPIFLEQWLK